MHKREQVQGNTLTDESLRGPHQQLLAAQVVADGRLFP